MKIFLMSALLLTAACSSHDDPTPRPLVKIRPTVDLVAVTVTGMAPATPRPSLRVDVLSSDGKSVLFTGTETKAAAVLPARFWMPGSYKGNQSFRVGLVVDGRPGPSVLVDPEAYAGNHRFNVGEGAVDLTVELAF